MPGPLLTNKDLDVRTCNLYGDLFGGGPCDMPGGIAKGNGAGRAAGADAT